MGHLKNGSLPLPCWPKVGIILVVNAANCLLLRMRYGKRGRSAVQRQGNDT